MAFTDEFAEAFAEVVPELNQSFTWAGSDYPCWATDRAKSANLEPAGWGVTADLIINVQGSLFETSSPERGQTVTFDSTTYRIDEVRPRPNSCILRLACVNASRGA